MSYQKGKYSVSRSKCINYYDKCLAHSLCISEGHIILKHVIKHVKPIRYCIIYLIIEKKLLMKKQSSCKERWLYR